MNPICQISNEPGGNLLHKPSRLFPNKMIWVKKELYDKGYEPRGFVVLYGRALIDDGRQSGQGTYSSWSQDKLFTKIIADHLYIGDDVTVAQLIKL